MKSSSSNTLCPYMVYWVCKSAEKTLVEMCIPLIGKDGDDVINNVTCALTGTGSIRVHIVYMGNIALNRIKRLKSSTKTA